MVLHLALQIKHYFDLPVHHQKIELFLIILLPWAAHVRLLVRVLELLQLLLQILNIPIKIDKVLQNEQDLLNIMLGSIGSFHPLIQLPLLLKVLALLDGLPEQVPQLLLMRSELFFIALSVLLQWLEDVFRHYLGALGGETVQFLVVALAVALDLEAEGLHVGVVEAGGLEREDLAEELGWRGLRGDSWRVWVLHHLY